MAILTIGGVDVPVTDCTETSRYHAGGDYGRAESGKADQLVCGPCCAHGGSSPTG